MQEKKKFWPLICSVEPSHYKGCRLLTAEALGYDGAAFSYSGGNMKRLQDKVVLVTGGGRGIGRAICLRLAEEGAKVAVVDILLNETEQVAVEIKKSGGQAIAVQTDVTSLEQVRACVQTVTETWGRLDVLVNNAGWDKLEPFVESKPETWEKVIAINLKGPISFCHAVIPHMIARQAGKIISISSDAGRVGSSGEAVYSACKAGIIGFSKTLARELARAKINVNVVCPGPTETPLLKSITEGSAGAKVIDAMTRAVPFRRLGQPEEIAAAVAFFASPDADFVTGQVLSVSGGLTMAG
jgi:2-hydroxycyclohexanecarboxyl-CoA dehydrogenase